MRNKALGKAHGTGITPKQITPRCPSDAASEQWFIKQRCPYGVCCPYGGSLIVQTDCQHQTTLFRCREKACGWKRFSTKTGIVMAGSKIGHQDWIVAMLLVTTSLRSVSSMKLQGDPGITQKSAWFLAHRLCTALSEGERL